MARKFHESGMSNERRQESKEAGMISENRSAMANLPQEVIMKPYPKMGGWLPEDYDDTLGGIDRQMNADNRKKMSGFAPKKEA